MPTVSGHGTSDVRRASTYTSSKPIAPEAAVPPRFVAKTSSPVAASRPCAIAFGRSTMIGADRDGLANIRDQSARERSSSPARREKELRDEPAPPAKSTITAFRVAAAPMSRDEDGALGRPDGAGTNDQRA